jgi:ACS family tartrate transporter-like MFS transporter
LSATHPIERSTIAKVSWRILPLAAVAYCIAYIDRTNVSFAALTMNKDLGLTAYLYGWGAGIFFFSYFLFEIPSNLILERVGARMWIARIMLTWGIISGLTAFATGSASFLVYRFLLGAAEAGFFPGMILYFTYWYPGEYRGRVISTLFIAQPIANALASIVSGAIQCRRHAWPQGLAVGVHPGGAAGGAAGRRGVEGAHRPARGRDLARFRGAELARRPACRGTPQDRRRRQPSLVQALADPRVLALAAIYFMSVTANYGIVFVMPQIVKGMGLTNQMTGFVASVPYIVGTVGLIAWGWSSDRSDERHWHLIAASWSPPPVSPPPAGSAARFGRWPACRPRRSASMARARHSGRCRPCSSPAPPPPAPSRLSMRPAISAAIWGRSWSAGSRTRPTVSRLACISSRPAP